MKVRFCGIEYVHPSDFCIDKPLGSGDYLLIFARTPFILISNGNVQKCPAGTTVFFHKGKEQRFMASGSTYANDFIHFDIKEDEEDFLKSLKIPHATPLTGIDFSMFVDLIHYMSLEQLSNYPRSKESQDYLLRYLLIKLSEALWEASEYPTAGTLKTRMNKLRSEIYDNVKEPWTIAKMAESVHISESYFLATYKQLFGVSAIADVINARMEKAKLFLSSTDYPISKIAELCGFNNESHFSRQFKKTVGVTAGTYKDSLGKS